MLSALHDAFDTSSFAVVNVEIVGPKVGAELRRQAVYVTLYALGGMLIYIAIRFEWVYGAAAVLAVFHDVLITLGFFSLLHFEISLTVIAALLTLVGYSMNDTIVIFDRIRENLRLMRREPFATIVNRSINQTLSRTILTSGLTFLTVLVLFVMGGPVLHSFSFALVVGILVGTYLLALPHPWSWLGIVGGARARCLLCSFRIRSQAQNLGRGSCRTLGPGRQEAKECSTISWNSTGVRGEKKDTTVGRFFRDHGSIGYPRRLILIPLIYTQALPKAMLATMITAPPPPPPRPRPRP